MGKLFQFLKKSCNKHFLSTLNIINWNSSFLTQESGNFLYIILESKNVPNKICENVSVRLYLPLCLVITCCSLYMIFVADGGAQYIIHIEYEAKQKKSDQKSRFSKKQ